MELIKGDPESRSGCLLQLRYDFMQSPLKISSWQSLPRHHSGEAGESLNLVRDCKAVRRLAAEFSYWLYDEWCSSGLEQAGSSLEMQMKISKRNG